MHLVSTVLLHAIFSLVSAESSPNEIGNHTLNLSLEHSEEDASDTVNSNDINIRRGVHIYPTAPFDNGGGIQQAQVKPMRPSPHYPPVPHNPFVRDPNRHPNEFSPQFLDSPTSQLGPNLPYYPYYQHSNPSQNHYGPQITFPVKQPPQDRKPELIPQTELYLPPGSNSYPKESIKQPLPQTQDLIKPRESFPLDQGPDKSRYEQNEPPQPDPNPVPLLPPGPLTMDPSSYLHVHDGNQQTPIKQLLQNPSQQLPPGPDQGLNRYPSQIDSNQPPILPLEPLMPDQSSYPPDDRNQPPLTLTGCEPTSDCNKPSGQLPDSPLQGPDRYVKEPVQLDLNKSLPPGQYFPNQELLKPPIDSNEPSYFAPQTPNPPPPPPKVLDPRDPYSYADDQPLAPPNQIYPEAYKDSLPPMYSPCIPDIYPNAPAAAPQYTNSPRPIPTQTVELFPIPSHTGVKQPTLSPPEDYPCSPEDGPYPPIETPNRPISNEPFPIQSEPTELQGNLPPIGDQDEDDLSTVRDSLDELDEELIIDPADSYLPDQGSRDHYPPSEDLYNPEPGSVYPPNVYIPAPLPTRPKLNPPGTFFPGLNQPSHGPVYPFQNFFYRPVPYPFPRESYTSRPCPPIQDYNNPRSPSIFTERNQVLYPNIPNTHIHVHNYVQLTPPCGRCKNPVMMMPCREET